MTVLTMLSAVLTIWLSACTFDGPSSVRQLEVVTAKDIVGRYLSDNDNGYTHVLTVRQLSETTFVISIRPESGQGCTFNSNADLTGREIHIALSNINKKLSGVMTIAFDGASARIDSLTPDTHADLRTFCRGGRSLIGNYLKVK
ncbi:MAG: hypothetical protein CSA45_04395 [Gammaproteobacteria bacterium]|nr:MAG: hypothetical protein CSA45_04395 [Gammaproteobacteria bacterium]